MYKTTAKDGLRILKLLRTVEDLHMQDMYVGFYLCTLHVTFGSLYTCDNRSDIHARN